MATDTSTATNTTPASLSAVAVARAVSVVGLEISWFRRIIVAAAPESFQAFVPESTRVRVPVPVSALE